MLNADDEEILGSFASSFAQQLATDVAAQQVTIESSSDILISSRPSDVAGDVLVTLRGDGLAHNFDLDFIGGGSSAAPLGSISTTVFGSYAVYFDAVDDGDGPLTFDWADGSLDHGASLITSGQDARLIGDQLVWEPQAPGEYDFGVKVTDEEGKSTDIWWTVEVELPSNTNSKPYFTGVSPYDDAVGGLQPIAAQVGRAYELELEVTDPDGDDLVYHVVDNPDGSPTPAGIRVDRNTGIVTWVPGSDQLGEHHFTVRVSDGRLRYLPTGTLDNPEMELGEAFQTFTIEVVPKIPGNVEPLFTSDPFLHAFVDTPYLYDAHGFDLLPRAPMR